jgi:hypothetical protein
MFSISVLWILTICNWVEAAEKNTSSESDLWKTKAMKQYSFGKFFCSLTITDYTISRQQQEAVSLCRQSAIQVEWSHKICIHTNICKKLHVLQQDKNCKNCKKGSKWEFVWIIMGYSRDVSTRICYDLTVWEFQFL